jgi:hypothetical protein
LTPRTWMTTGLASLLGSWLGTGCCPFPCWSGPEDANLAVLLPEDSCGTDIRDASIHAEGQATEDGEQPDLFSTQAGLEKDGDRLWVSLPIYTAQHEPCDLALKAEVSLLDRWGDEIAPDGCPAFTIQAETNEEGYWDTEDLITSFVGDRKWDGLEVYLVIHYRPYCHFL